ncbi:unnamed protein product [Adineta ricciae]|uniref:G-protein coupled receptors family 1 profile domain-containing protein n=1 Tax=Adineta ricciae TaxID=249248 RepID=A0A814QFJ5_ADIRI|nr:unnamed protein product [Adineta ricciae]CAF1165522.1 unnamed protein product [Adineta ricciae]
MTLASQLTSLTTTLMTYYMTFIYVIGILGNLTNILIFSRRKLRSNTCSRYFIGMSVAQIFLFNTFGLTRVIISRTGVDLAGMNVGLCKLRIFVYIFSLGLTRQFLCLISIDRWILSTQHARIRQFSSPRLATSLIIGSVCFWLMFSIHGLIGYETTSAHFCGAPLGSAYAQFYAIQITISSIVPFLIISVFTLLTLHNVRHYRRIQIIQPAVNVVISTKKATTNRSLSMNVSHYRREFQLMKVSLLQVIFYVVFAMTSTIFPLYSYLTSTLPKSTDQLAIDAFIVSTALILLYTYTASTFFLYTWASKTFRKELLLTFVRLVRWMKRVHL